MRSEKRRPSPLAKPLLTSLGIVTMLTAGSFVLLAVASTGSARPWDWTRADPAAAFTRYQLCGHQGLGVIGCMLSAGVRPAAAAAPAGAEKSLQPLLSVATVQDSGQTQAPASRQGTGAAGGGSTAVPAPAGGLRPRCPTVRVPQAQGAAASQAPPADCRQAPAPSPSPSGSPEREGGDD